MSGFHTIGDIRDAIDAGQQWISSFNKSPPAVATIAGQWFDLSTGARNPVPNYYASSPLEAATLNSDKGIIHGPDVAPLKKFVKSLMLVNAASGAAVTTSQNMPMILCDIVMYYPYIDLDAAGEVQILTNDIALPRYQDGAGLRMMLIAQAATLGGGKFTVNYTNSDGLAARTTPEVFCPAAGPTGSLQSATVNAAGVHPWLPFQSGDRGVRSCQSVTVDVANGGLGALCIVKPLLEFHSMEESRQSATPESIGSAVEVEAITLKPGAAEIKDNAFLTIIGQGTAGTIASAGFVGILETIWN
jgi:hypothetical protein